MILFEHFNSTPRAAIGERMGKSLPVADADVLLEKITKLSAAGSNSKEW
jgi:hypothetical protein